MTEKKMQAILMEWAMEEKKHVLVLPNSKNFFGWEADLITGTKNGMVHEFEIKCSFSDYKSDFRKKSKHSRLKRKTIGCPNYFWYAISGFNISTPPSYAGLIRVGENGRIDIVKQAPRLNTTRHIERRIEDVTRWMSYKLKNLYAKEFLDG